MQTRMAFFNAMQSLSASRGDSTECALPIFPGMHCIMVLSGKVTWRNIWRAGSSAAALAALLGGGRSAAKWHKGPSWRPSISTTCCELLARRPVCVPSHMSCNALMMGVTRWRTSYCKGLSLPLSRLR